MTTLKDQLKEQWEQARKKVLQDPEWHKQQARLRRWAQIEKQVGTTPPDRLGWAVTFAQEDLDDFTPGKWTDTTAELRAFCNFPFGGFHAPRRASLLRIDEWPTRQLTEDDIRAVHREFQKFLAVLVVDKWADSGDLSIGITVHLTQDPEHPERSGVSVVGRTDSVVTKALWGLVTLLTAYGGQLRQCPECRRFFVASRTNRAFCGTRCASRKSTRAYRQRQDATAHTKKVQVARRPRRKGGKVQ